MVIVGAHEPVQARMHARTCALSPAPNPTEASAASSPVVAALLCGGRLSPMFGGAMVHARLHARDDRIARTAARRRARLHQPLPPKRLGLLVPHSLRTGAPLARARAPTSPRPPRGVAPRTRPPRPPAHTRSRPARALGSRGARPGRGRGGGGEGRERAGASARTGTLSRAASRRVASQSPRCVRGPFARSLVARAKGHAPADKPGLTPCRPGMMPGSRK